jgi:Copper type II ascorbate-dependent monooxygenase, C-terminal domain
VAADAESILAGTLSLTLPPKQQTSTPGTCSITSESTLFAVQPHMHQLGTHMKVVARIGGVDQLIHDGDYDFNDQPIYPMQPLKMSPGDTLHVECTHFNTTDAVVNWGESSKAEMCHTGVYRYPAASPSAFFCAF